MSWHSAMGENQNLVNFLQRAVGHALTGDISEQCVFILHGVGSNGKSTFLEVLRMIFNDYAKQTGFDTFLVKKNSQVRNDLACLVGARMVTASEVESGEVLSEVVVKQMTGGEPVMVRHLYREFFEFVPVFKAFLAANHKPVIRGSDNGIWRRIFLVPFGVTFKSKHELKNGEKFGNGKIYEKDKALKDKLMKELPGILAWVVKGCLKWQKNGLQPPKEVLYATETYQEDMDILADFLSECCTIEESGRCSIKELYEVYKKYCSERDEKALGKQKFNTKIEERGFTRTKVRGERKWKGISFIPADDNFSSLDSVPNFV